MFAFIASHIIAGRISACHTNARMPPEPELPEAAFVESNEANDFELDQLLKGIAQGFGFDVEKSHLVSDIIDISLKVLPYLFDEENEANSRLIHLLKPFIPTIAPLFDEENLSGKQFFEGIKTAIQTAIKVAPVVLPYILKQEENNGFWESLGKGLGKICKMGIEALPTFLSEENGEDSELLELINRIKEQIKDFPVMIPQLLEIAKRFAEYMKLDKPSVDYEEDANEVFDKITQILKKAIEAAIQELVNEDEKEEENLSVPVIRPVRSFDDEENEEVKEVEEPHHHHHHHHHHHKVHSPRKTFPKKHIQLG